VSHERKREASVVIDVMGIITTSWYTQLKITARLIFFITARLHGRPPVKPKPFIPL
jgi:hypothetical protein